MRRKEKKELVWRRLDNSAKIFPLSSSRKYSSVFRISAVMKDKVSPKLLEKAVNNALNKFEFFKVRLRKGFFWYYFEYNDKKIVIEEEKDYPCKYIDPNTNNDYLFKVTYFDKKINIDIFHSLTDGNSAVQFFKEIVYQYIEIEYAKDFKNVVRTDRKFDFNIEDSYLKNYNKKAKNNSVSKKAYILKGRKIPFETIRATHEIIDLTKLKEISKQKGVTITQFLTAVLIKAIYLGNMKNTTSNKPIKICVPVNLKKYFKSKTLSNFFSYITVTADGKKVDFNNLDDVLKLVKSDFENLLKPEEVMKTMSLNVKLGNNFFIRIIPLFMKQIFVRLSYLEIRKYTTTTFSNIGRIGIIADYQKYIEDFFFLIAPERVEKIKCSTCSYEDKMFFTFTSILMKTNIEDEFKKILEELGIHVEIESNGV